MEKVELGITGEFISTLGLGTMYFGTKVDRITSMNIMDIYCDKGGSFIDSANKYANWIPGYKGGESENLIGEWLKLRNNRNKIFLTSKVGFPYGDIPRSLTKDIIISECEKSLARMGVDTIDMYFAHAYDKHTPIEETMEAFSVLKQQGKIRFMAASNFPSWRLAEANQVANSKGWEGIVCVQQRHTYLESSLRATFGNQLLLTPEIEDFCSSKNITMMGYSPLLSGAYTEIDKPMPIQYKSENTNFRLNILKEISNELGITQNQLVLAWMLNSTPRVLPTIAGSNSRQIEENIAAGDIQLSDQLMARLNRVELTKVY